MTSAEYDRLRGMGYKINMARGKPEARQMDLANGLLHCLDADDCICEDGADARNYGGPDGLTETKLLFSEILSVPAKSVIVGGNSSINMMFDCMATLILAGLWKRGDKFICPAPGYDRHFAMCEYFGLEMLPVKMTPDGPDMEAVEELAQRPDVVGMWNVPVFSNPQGYVYSKETVNRLNMMPAGHPHFKIFWDNAYSVHHFRGARPEFKTELNDRALLFTSLSKVSFAGAAVAAMAASEDNRVFFMRRVTTQTVGPDKINQLRHVKYFKNLNGILAHMEKHAEIMRPKFDLANEIFTARLSGVDGLTWTNPDGGYFIDLRVPTGRAKKTEALCKEAGLTITEAGAVFPYKHDPEDSHLRIAPSYLPLDELKTALEILCAAVRLATV